MAPNKELLVGIICLPSTLTFKGNLMSVLRQVSAVSRFARLLLCSSLVLMGAQVNATDAPEQLYPALTKEVLPELASRGAYGVGVRTLSVVNPQQFDPSTQQNKDRSLTLEVWYPAALESNAPLSSYEDETRTGIKFSIQANAVRDAKINEGGTYPLVVMSHGYTGYRSIMFYLGEHLASHGYIVASIDHTDSTNADVDMINAPFSGFVSTLLNRSRDQQFVLAYFRSQANFANTFVDTQHAGLVGYSMGGFGAVNTIGGCYDFNAVNAAMFTGTSDPALVPQVQQLLNSCAGGQYQDIKVDPSWKAMVAFAPWGGQHQLFKPEAMAKITTPVLYIAGDLDDVSGYSGIQSLYELTGSDKYMLTYHNARHNVAPHPAPAAASGSEMDLGHYYEPAWSSRTLNEINKHFVLAMFDCHVKGLEEQCQFLDLPENGDQRPVDGKVPPPWLGFDNRFSTGMSWQSSKAKNTPQ